MFTEAQLVEKVKLGYQAAKEFARPIFNQASRDFNLYVGKRPKRKLKSEANFHVPYAATLVDNVRPILTAKQPFAKVRPRNIERDYKAADLMNELLTYANDVNNFEQLFISWQHESTMTPIAWLKVIWEYQDKKTDCPKISHPDSYSIRVHPRKVMLDDRWPIYQATEMTKEEMKEMGWDKRKIDALSKSTLETESYRRERMQALGLAVSEKTTNKITDETDDLYLVIEAWGKMRLDKGDEKEVMTCIVVANGEKIINKPVKGKRLHESPYDHGMFPFVPLRYNSFPHLFYGESLISQIATQQDELNALENMKADNYRRRNNPPLKVRRSGHIDLDTLKFVGSVPWLVNEPGDITQEVLEDLAPSIDNQQNMIRATMQNRVGANDVLLVSDVTDIKGGQTATGAAIANENTKLRFRPHAKAIDIAIQRVGELCIGLYQQKNLFDRKKSLAIADKEGREKMVDIRPEDVTGDLVYVGESASTLAESNTNKLNKLMNIKEMYAEDPSYNQESIDKQIFMAADLDYESMKIEKETQFSNLALTLRKLVTLVRTPGFQNRPAEEKTRVFAQIRKIRDMLGGGGVAPETAPVSTQETMTEEGAATQ